MPVPQPTTLPYPDPPLTDGTVRLRRWEPTDLPCVREASEDPVIPAGTTIPPSYTDSEGRAWIERQWQRADRGEGLSLAITEAATGRADGAVVLLRGGGWATPANRRPPDTAALGYWMLRRARGRGSASRAVQLLAPWALARLGLARVEALVEPDNIASQRVLERAGFQQEGRLRAYLAFDGWRSDAFMYSLLPTDLPAP